MCGDQIVCRPGGPHARRRLCHYHLRNFGMSKSLFNDENGHGISSPDRVATAQGKQGIWKSIFPDRENTVNLPQTTNGW